MFFSWQIFLAFCVGAATTLLAGWILTRSWFRAQKRKARERVAIAKKEAALAAREIRSEALLDIERERSAMGERFAAREEQVQDGEQKLRTQRGILEQDTAQLEQRRKEMEADAAELQRERETCALWQAAYRRKLQSIGKLTYSEARELLLREMRENAADEIREIRREIIHSSEEEARNEANRILLDVMQRLSTSVPSEVSAALVNIPDEEMKGRIIGREGRNIRSFENATGVTLMIDDTPGSILVSSFDPVRREIAREALQRLIASGRIHPASIEETVEEVTVGMKENVITLGEQALRHLRLNKVHPEIISLLGSLHYRLSNNQNTLEHSVEVASICALIAAELGVDPVLAKRCGLFHDLGKALEQDYDSSHADAAARLLKRHGEPDEVINAVAASHQEVAATSVYAEILKVADSVSAARPGARADSLDGYLQRIRSLEALAADFEGVREAYAVQAGREIRVIVEPDKLRDEDSRELSRNIRRRIEDELQYPGSIKVTVIREQRFSDTAF